MNRVEALFENMDKWRHLPNYQLERRADLFFSLYLPRALEEKFGCRFKATLIPEFPVRIGTIYPNISTDKSYKIDYIAMTEDESKIVLVELKTEGASRRESQDKYLSAAQKVGIGGLLRGVLDIFRASSAKHKYFALLEQLEGIQLLKIPEDMRAIMQRETLQGVNEASKKVEITEKTTSEPAILYVQPNGAGPDIINFHEFAEVVKTENDPISKRFAESLITWATIPAGGRESNEESIG